ncbi:hypothetical protein MtrunA17_Chr1g0167431 [Medicago truncatula]|uniref:Ulp1 protease family, carboxy-terminal domain protein n=2 Tax=Medicago truncatula TaxID=3880 RepID=A0A396JQS1_MEDTR|nr:hypothetical protein MtrunA17_Chr1g0167431 [Medicago truncatula]
MERRDALYITKPIACKRFIERLKKFKYMDWKAIDPTSLEYIMTPALIGNPGSHYVCFVVNLKSQKLQFMNSLIGETLHKKMFDVWLKEVEAFVTELYKKRKITMSFQFSTFK